MWQAARLWDRWRKKPYVWVSVLKLDYKKPRPPHSCENRATDTRDLVDESYRVLLTQRGWTMVPLSSSPKRGPHQSWPLKLSTLASSRERPPGAAGCWHSGCFCFCGCVCLVQIHWVTCLTCVWFFSIHVTSQHVRTTRDPGRKRDSGFAGTQAQNKQRLCEKVKDTRGAWVGPVEQAGWVDGRREDLIIAGHVTETLQRCW